MTAEEQLRQCPFCGQTTTLVVSGSSEFHDEDCCGRDHDDSYAVFCDASTEAKRGGCGASGGFQPTKAKAVAKWNRRVS